MGVTPHHSNPDELTRRARSLEVHHPVGSRSSLEPAFLPPPLDQDLHDSSFPHPALLRGDPLLQLDETVETLLDDVLWRPLLEPGCDRPGAGRVLERVRR